MTLGANASLLSQMRTECSLAQSFVGEMDRSAFLSDVLTQRAVTMTFVILAELADRLQLNDPTLASRVPDFPLAEIRGMRNRIVHGYYFVDQDVVWETVATSIPALIASLDALQSAS